jgi:ABC-2 type transport system ATP-binding protein
MEQPIRHVGAVLEATSFHPGRRARDHLKLVASASGISESQVDKSLDQVGLSDVANRRVGKFSLGMRQRLQLAIALVGEPDVLILDEPSNGLDPQGMQWLRNLIRCQAAIGRAVLISSHLLSEMEETVDDVVIVSQGTLVLQNTLEELGNQATSIGTRVRTRELPQLIAALDDKAVAWRQTGSDTLVIEGATSDWFGPFAAEHRIVLDEVVHERGSLEDVFLRLTRGYDAVDPDGHA